MIRWRSSGDIPLKECTELGDNETTLFENRLHPVWTTLRRIAKAGFLPLAALSLPEPRDTVLTDGTSVSQGSAAAPSAKWT
jgi:hypothetical protein